MTASKHQLAALGLLLSGAASGFLSPLTPLPRPGRLRRLLPLRLVGGRALRRRAGGGHRRREQAGHGVRDCRLVPPRPPPVLPGRRGLAQRARGDQRGRPAARGAQPHGGPRVQPPAQRRVDATLRGGVRREQAPEPYAGPGPLPVLWRVQPRPLRAGPGAEAARGPGRDRGPRDLHLARAAAHRGEGRRHALRGSADSVEVKARVEEDSGVRLTEVYETATVLGQNVELPEALQYSRELYVAYLDEDLLVVRDSAGVPEILVRK